jgi:hypothetical protein
VLPERRGAICGPAMPPETGKIMCPEILDFFLHLLQVSLDFLFFFVDFFYNYLAFTTVQVNVLLKLILLRNAVIKVIPI